MVGICSLFLSLTDSFRGEEAAASGIGRYLRSFNARSFNFRSFIPGSGNRLGRQRKRRPRGGGIFRNRSFGSFEFFHGRRIEDAIGKRSERSLERRQDLLPRGGSVGVNTIQGIDFGLDLRAEFVGRAPELVEEARHLAADLGHFLGAEKDQGQKKQEDHLAGEAEIHGSIIMPDEQSGPLASWRRQEIYREEEKGS